MRTFSVESKRFMLISVILAPENINLECRCNSMRWILLFVLLPSVLAQKTQVNPTPVDSTQYLHIRYLVDRKILPDGKFNLIYPASRIYREQSVLLAYNFLRHIVEDRRLELRSPWFKILPVYRDVSRHHFLGGRLNFLMEHGIFAETGWELFESRKPLTRYELIRLGYEILRSVRGIPQVTIDPREISVKRLYKDVPNWHYAAPMLVALTDLGIINANWGENLQGDDEVNRIEVARFMVEIIKFLKMNFNSESHHK